MRISSSGGMVITAAALFLFCESLSGASQEPSGKQAPSFRSGVELVSIDVSVVDKQGRPLRGLEPRDFTVTVAGRPRRVVTAEFVDTTAAQAKQFAQASDTVPISTNEGGGVGRLFVFVVDQNTLEPGNSRQAAIAASHFLDRLTFADRSALMLLPVGPNIGFTWAHQRVRSGLERATGFGLRTAMWEYGSLSEARDIANRNLLTARTVMDRECRGSIFASGGGGGGFSPGGQSPGGGGGGPTPPPSGGGGGTPPGESGGSGTTPPPSGGGGTGGGGTRSPGIGGGFGGDACSRDLQMQAEATWREAETTSLSSIAALRQLLAVLGRVRGDKTVILISGGWPLDEREEHSVLTSVAADATAARATVFTVFVPRSTFSADRRMMTGTPARDQYLHVGPLETLAGMTGGGTFRAEVNPEAVFDRLARELSGFYRIGVERDPIDNDGKSRRMKVQVARGGLTVRTRDMFDVRTYEDRDWAARLASALEAPVPATAVGLRVTSYISSDPDDAGNVRVVLTGEASRVQSGEATFQILVHDVDGKKVFSGDHSLGEPTGDRLPFATNVALPVGSYIIRVAVMDGAGRVGSVDHRVDARPLAFGALSATGPLLVRVPATGRGEPSLAWESVRQDERLALEVDLAGDRAHLDGADVSFEIASSADGPPLVRSAANLANGPREGTALAQAVTDIRLLPPGNYIARAKIRAGGDSTGELRRAFVITEAPVLAADAAATATVPHAPVSFAARAVSTVPRFVVDQVLSPPILNPFLDRVAARPDATSAVLRGLLDRARTTDISQLVVDTDDEPVAAFLKGLTLLSQKKVDDAAAEFRKAMRSSADFYPAMVYLGACYAALGNDKDAAGAWRTALIKEGDAIAVHTLLTDALLRQGRGDLALQAVDGARARWPEDQGLQRRFAMAALLAGRNTEGLDALDELLDKQLEDEPTLALGLLVLYEAFVNGRPVETVQADRARMMRLADAYRTRGGPSLALIETWVAAAKK